MTCFVSHTSVDCHNAYELSEWWKSLLGYQDIPDDPNEPGHEECMILDPDTGHRILFIEVPDEKVAKNRIHYDVSPVDCSHDDEVARLLALGATHADVGQTGEERWTVLADPEGNEFCVLRSLAEGHFSL